MRVLLVSSLDVPKQIIDARANYSNVSFGGKVKGPFLYLMFGSLIHNIGVPLKAQQDVSQNRGTLKIGVFFWFPFRTIQTVRKLPGVISATQAVHQWFRDIARGEPVEIVTLLVIDGPSSLVAIGLQWLPLFWLQVSILKDRPCNPPPLLDPLDPQHRDLGLRSSPFWDGGFDFVPRHTSRHTSQRSHNEGRPHDEGLCARVTYSCRRAK